MNPLYKQFGQNQNFMKRFEEFRRTFNGDPQQAVQQMLNSGKITQEQLNQAAQKVNQLMKLMK